ncbi:MAG: 5'/3'-nucleotidase SurE [Halorientalis sp.]
MADLQILLTNDDGIESQGFRALYDALSTIAEVTAVAPADDKSAVGRAMSHSVGVSEHELGYAIEGTPADCVVAGIEALVPDADMVVAGCNRGANLGAYVLGRSGTVSAAVEAAFFDVPAIAVSLYVPVGEDTSYADVEVDYDDYQHATDAARYLVAHSVDAGVFDHAEYLNVNAPVPDPDSVDAHPEMVVTEPSTAYLMTAVKDDDEISLQDGIWKRMADGDIPDPPGTDRHAVVDGKVSISPLTAPHTTEHHDALEALAETYPDSFS